MGADSLTTKQKNKKSQGNRCPYSMVTMRELENGKYRCACRSSPSFAWVLWCFGIVGKCQPHLSLLSAICHSTVKSCSYGSFTRAGRYNDAAVIVKRGSLAAKTTLVLQISLFLRIPLNNLIIDHRKIKPRQKTKNPSLIVSPSSSSSSSFWSRG